MAPGFPLACNPGSISPQTIRHLLGHGIQPRSAEREPARVEESDFDQFTRWIALSAIEHRPMMTEQFPHRLSLVEFWEIEDDHLETADSALGRLAVLLDGLLAELQMQTANAIRCNLQPGP